MFRTIAILLQGLLVVVGLSAPAAPSAAAMTLVAFAAVAMLAIAMYVVTGPAATAHPLAIPRRAIDVSVRPSQSDPDAAGHSRPRAPGFVASAA